MTRTILHVDLDAFFCAVEVLRHPELKGRPFVVGGSADARGVVSSASYEARKFGIRSAMPTAQAQRLLPDLIVISSRHSDYSRASLQVMDILRKTASLMEQISIDEAFLDVSDLPEPGEAVAKRLQNEIEQSLGLPTSWGVASSKLVAKIATEVGKPKGCIVVPAGEEERFLAPLPVEMLWGVGPKTREILNKSGIRTIGQLAAASTTQLVALFGSERGLELAARARGDDQRPVREDHERRSISHEHTFASDVGSLTELERTMLGMSVKLGRRLRKDHLACQTVKIKVRWPDFTTITRQIKLSNPTHVDDEIYLAAQKLFRSVWKQGRKVRLLGIGVTDLGSQVRQLELFDHSWEQDERLMQAIDTIRERYGKDAVKRAGSMRADR